MTAIGETLRRERLRRNLDLETISRELKISAKLLEAIEDNQFDRLPGGVFAKAFVRQYAHLLGLDEEEMANEVQRILQPAAEGPQLAETFKPGAQPIQLPPVEHWDAISDSRFNWSSPLPALALVVVVMMGCAGVYSWWQRTRHTTVSAHESAAPGTTAAAPAVQLAQPPPVQVQAAVEVPVQATVPDQPPAAPTPSPAPPDALPAAAADGTTASQPAVTPVAEVKSATTAAPLPTQPSNPNAAVRVELVADEAVWVLAKTDGKFLFSGTIEANQSRMVEANNTVLLRIGNAGGVNLTLNGKPIGVVGPKGQVRTVQLTSGGFEIVAAPKPPSAPLVPLR